MRIDHLFRTPEHVPTVAGWIHAEFWDHAPDVTAAALAARLREATRTDRIPLAFVAFDGDAPVGTVSLVENDDEARPDLRPWLAALYVRPAARGRGLGAMLVRECLAAAARLGETRVHLGTSTPVFYARLGAETLGPVGVRGLVRMRFALSG